MAELVCKSLRDGAQVEGQDAPALTIKDSINSPFGLDVFVHVLTQLSSDLLAGKSRSRGIVLLAFSQSPLYYIDLLKHRGIDITSSHKWFQILDCYTDPLGWKDQVPGIHISQEASSIATLCKDVRDLEKLFSSIIVLGKGILGQGKGRFSVAIDSVTEMLRHASVSSAASFLSDIRSHDQIFSTFWLLHSDLHEVRATAVLEYMSSMVASLEPANQSKIGHRGSVENHSLFELDSRNGKFHVRSKRGNGRVKVICEEFHVEQSGIKFTAASSSDEGIINQGLLPKVPFNLQLSQRELIDREKVVLPFEHQGTEKPIEIYDGRKSLMEIKSETGSVGKPNGDSSRGEINYQRETDDEADSDEDPDDDLDI